MSSSAPEASVGFTSAVLVALQLLSGCGNGGTAASPSSAGTTAQTAIGYGGSVVPGAAGRTATGAGGANPSSTGNGASSGQATTVPDPAALDGSAHPADGGVSTIGGTMTFLNVGAEGFWPRRLDRDPSDPACTVKSGKDTWAGPCCLTAHATASNQSGHVGGNVCGSGCSRAGFPVQQDVVNACTKTAYSKAPTLTMGGAVDGCPVWVRPAGDRYLIALLDAERRIIQVGMLHPQALPQTLGALLPALPAHLSGATVQAIAELRLPVGG